MEGRPSGLLTVSELAKIQPAMRVVPAGTLTVFIHFSAAEAFCTGRYFRKLGPTSRSFDHHIAWADGSPTLGKRAILECFPVLSTEQEACDQFIAALRSAFGDTHVIDLRTDTPSLIIQTTHRDLHLLDLTSRWATEIGIGENMSSGASDLTRAWSRHFYDAYQEADGLLSSVSVAGANCLGAALYERSTNAMSMQPLVERPLSDALLFTDLERAARKLGYGILP